MISPPQPSDTTREQLVERLAAAQAGGGFVRESRTLGATGAPLRWRDTRDDLVRRAAMWRLVFEQSNVSAGDRVMLRLPAYWAVGGDCLLSLMDLGVLWTGADDGWPLDFAPTILVTTPTDALRVAREHDMADSGVRLVFVTGEPGGSIASTRRTIEERFGARCVDVYALTESGVVGWSCIAAPGGVHLNTDAFAFQTDGTAVAELCVTTREQRGTPLRHYRTGDLATLSGDESCACGSRWPRAEGGILGRVCERFAVRGVEVLPSSIEDVVRRHPAVCEFAILVYGSKGLGVRIEPDAAIASESDRARVAAEVSEDLKRSLGVRLQCDVVPPGSLGDQDAGRRARRLSRQ